MRRPNDRALRLQAAQKVAAVAEHLPADNDQLLHEIVGAAKLLRRALDRTNSAPHVVASDLAAVRAWIDKLQPFLERALTR